MSKLNKIDKDVWELIEKRSKGDLSWVKDSIIHLVDTGSHAYGTATPESDRDYKGIVIPPKQYHYGLKTFRSMEIGTTPTDIKNTSDDIDITLYSLHEFVRLAMKTNPNVIEMLYVEPENVYIESEMLLEIKGLFMTDHLKKTFGGYARSEQFKIEKGFKKGQFDSKRLMHTVRLLQMGAEALETGTMKTKRPNREELLELRALDIDPTDELDQQRVYGIIKGAESEFTRSLESTKLPKRADINKIEGHLMLMVEDFLKIG